MTPADEGVAAVRQDAFAHDTEIAIATLIDRMHSATMDLDTHITEALKCADAGNKEGAIGALLIVEWHIDAIKGLKDAVKLIA